MISGYTFCGGDTALYKVVRGELEVQGSSIECGEHGNDRRRVGKASLYMVSLREESLPYCRHERQDRQSFRHHCPPFTPPLRLSTPSALRTSIVHDHEICATHLLSSNQILLYCNCTTLSLRALMTLFLKDMPIERSSMVCSPR